jgi:Holliday junction resolvase
MAKPILPEVLREEIKELLQKGYTHDAVSKLIESEAKKYVNTSKQLGRCIISIERIVPVIPKNRIDYPDPPKSKEFDPKTFSNTIKSLNRRTPLKKIEEKGAEIAKEIIEVKEGFNDVRTGPNFPGTPFDLFGFKNKKPYIIELKASLNTSNYPGEIQKQRMQVLLRNIKGLHVALVQLKLKKNEYRIFYDNQMDLLFYGKKMPLGPIEKWINDRL